MWDAANRRPLTRIGAHERTEIVAPLRQVGGNRSKAASLLGIGCTTLYRKLSALGIDDDAWLSSWASHLAPRRDPRISHRTRRRRGPRPGLRHLVETEKGGAHRQDRRPALALPPLGTQVDIGQAPASPGATGQPTSALTRARAVWVSAASCATSGAKR